MNRDQMGYRYEVIRYRPVLSIVYAQAEKSHEMHETRRAH